MARTAPEERLGHQLEQLPSEDEEVAISETKGLASGSATPRTRARAAPVTLGQCLALASVPLLWGTFTPSMKLLLDHRHAPPVVLTNLLSHVAGTLALGVLWLCEAVPRGQCLPEPEAANADSAPSRRRMSLASCELGLYLFFGQLTQLLGLSGTSATTNAILVQSSVVLVPVIEEARSGLPAAGRLLRLLPSLLALIGIATITIAPSLMSTGSTATATSSAVTPLTWFQRQLGDAAVVAKQSAASGPSSVHAKSAGTGALGSPTPAAPSDVGDDEDVQSPFGIACSLTSAFFYALHTLRLTEYGDVDATVQATGQVAANAVLDLLAAPIAALVGGSGGNALRWLRHAYNAADQAALRRLAYAATWNGIFIVGATTWAMSYAQRTFRASTAALAYAMEPLAAAVLAALLLGESLGPWQLAGGVLIIAANILVGLRTRNE